MWASLVLLGACLLLGAADAGNSAPSDPAATGLSRDAGPAETDGSRGDDNLTSLETDPRTIALLLTAQRIHALMRGELALDVEPAALFSVDLKDEVGLPLELRRLRALVASALPQTLDGGTPDVHDATGGDSEVGPDATRVSAGGTGAVARERRWNARLALDRAQIAFLEKDGELRLELLADHERRRKEAENAKLTAAKVEVQQELATSQAAQAKALKDAEEANTKALRLIAEEVARLHGVRAAQAQFEATLIAREQAPESYADQAVESRARADDLIRRERSVDTSDAENALQTTDRDLSAARASLAEVLSAISTPPESIPGPGKGRLRGLDGEDQHEVEELREKARTTHDRLAAQAKSLRWNRAKLLLGQIENLNADRLSLYPLLSVSRRKKLTGFGQVGRAQASGELEQLTIVISYHARASARWLSELGPGGSSSPDGVEFAVLLAKLALVLTLFVWWKRSAQELLEGLESRLERRGVQGQRVRPERGQVALAVANRMRGPLEWLVLLWGLRWLLDSELADSLELRVVHIIALWVLGANSVVNGLDAWATAIRRPASRVTETAELRLRSLRLLGRVIVAVGLALNLGSELVGEGTIYTWIMSTCWFAALPLGLWLVRWWREPIFQRLELRRRSVFAGWIAARQSGWAAFPAAALGGTFLLGAGALRAIRSQVIDVQLVRRGLAYWFRRELTRQARERAGPDLRKVDNDAHPILDPEERDVARLLGVGDDELEEMVRSIDAPGGGVFALVGERGSGKSTLLERLAEERPTTLYLRCPAGGSEDLLLELRDLLGLERECPVEAVFEALEKDADNSALVIDDAHNLVRPVIGGLQALDSLRMSVTRASSQRTWVFAFDSAIWPFIARARGALPLFDDVIRIRPWREQDIARLLEQRCTLSGIQPNFDALLTELPEGSKEEDQEESRQSTQANYYRLLWDYSGGNPAVALQFWRKSLLADDDDEYHVELFSTPSTTNLERLPDPPVFVLRALLQLDYATVQDIVECTLLPPLAVQDAIRYALFRGYVIQVGKWYRIQWSWFRAVTRFLQRRHLISSLDTSQ